ncbi:UNVERIFIED_ORG: hypothetical protein ABIC48_003839 [Burkholderia territorii]
MTIVIDSVGVWLDDAIITIIQKREYPLIGDGIDQLLVEAHGVPEAVVVVGAATAILLPPRLPARSTEKRCDAADEHCCRDPDRSGRLVDRESRQHGSTVDVPTSTGSGFRDTERALWCPAWRGFAAEMGFWSGIRRETEVAYARRLVIDIKKVGAPFFGR